MMTKKRKRRNSDKGSSHLPVVVKDSIKAMFERRIVYKLDQPVHLLKPPGIHTTWEIPAIIAMKDELNTLKNNLNDKNMLSWHKHTRSVNIAGNIATQLRAKFRPELCTQAWCKFYEIASVFLQVDVNMPFFSVHLCEAPGAFVTSLNHYLLSIGYNGHWDWLATTLNPYYEGNSIAQMIDDDRFIHCSHGNWYFGQDGTGNLMSRENLTGLKHKLQDVQVDLVTADGSIDCQGDPAEQENVVSRLHYCEVITALHILSTSATLIVKMFTMFECRAISLMYLLNDLFEQVNVFKPCTSKGGNSEAYVICKGYKGKEFCESYLSWLTDLYFDDKDPEGCIFALADIPPTFLNQHTQCVEFFKDCQMTSIQRNLDLYKVKSEEEWSQLDQEKEYCMECFFSKYHMQPMMNKLRIMRPAGWNRPSRSDGARFITQPGEMADKVKLEGKFTGCFQERQMLSQLPWRQKVTEYETYEAEVGGENNSLWIRSMLGPLTEREVDWFTLQQGKPVDRIRSSRFCHNFYIVKAEEIIDNAQWLKGPVETSPDFVETVINQLVTVLSSALGYANNKQDTFLNQSVPENENKNLKGENQSLKDKNQTGKDENQSADSTDWFQTESENNKSVNRTVPNSKVTYQGHAEITGTGNSESNTIICDTLEKKSGDFCQSTENQQSISGEISTLSKTECKKVDEIRRSSNGIVEDTTIDVKQISIGQCHHQHDSVDDKIDQWKSGSHGSHSFKSVQESINDIKNSTHETAKDDKGLGARSRDLGSRSKDLGAGSKDLGAGSKDLGAGSKDLGSGSRDLGAGSNDCKSDDTKMDTGIENCETDGADIADSVNEESNLNREEGEDQDEMRENVGTNEDKLLQCEVKFQCSKEHSLFCQKLRNRVTGTGDIVRFYTVSPAQVGHDMEMSEHRNLCEVVMDVVERCEYGETVVIELGTSLTRVTAGLVYILYRSFAEIGFMHYHGSLLKRHLVCVFYQSCPINLHQCLREAYDQMDQCHPEAVLEILPVYTLLDDADYTSFLHISNTNLLQSFITTVINKERHLFMEL